MLLKWWRIGLALTFISSTAALAASEFSTSMSRAANMNGVSVPEVVIAIDRGVTTLDRQSVQGAVATALGAAGVKPNLVELQTVATAAINMAHDQEGGSSEICYETWCARVHLT